MILNIALLVVSLPLLAHGAGGLYHAARSQAQAKVSCADFHRERPASGWLQLTGCEIDYIRAGYRESRGTVTELFIPVRPIGSSPALPSMLVLSTQDPSLLAIVERGLTGPAQKDREAFLLMMLKIVTAMGISSEIEGFTRPPLEMLRTRGGLAAIKAPLDSRFTVLDLGTRPRLLFPMLEALGGGAGLLVLLLRAVRRRGGSPDEAAPHAAQMAATASAAAVRTKDDTRFRRLMLVNLPPHAPASALETAPPLGGQAAVRSALARVLPGITFDGDGVGAFNQTDCSMRLELGPYPDVWTATLDVTGDAAAEGIRRLVTQTGWQVYAPLLGRFLTSEDLKASS